MTYVKTKWGYSAETFTEFVKNFLDKKIDIPDGHELRIIVDNDAIVAELHPGWDDDGEELGDVIYIGKWWPHDTMIEALVLLGLPAEGA